MAEKPEAVITIRNVSKRFGKFTALDDVTFRVEKGKIHGFLGPNGAGKSTTIKIIMDFIRPSRGQITVFGKDSTKDSVAIKQEVGYLAGDMELYDNLTGSQYLQYVSNLKGDSGYNHLLKFAKSFEAVLDRKIGTLSRGNKQKIALLAALIGDPDLLILDEPTAGLDPLMQQKFYHVMREHARRGKTVLMSSHNLSEVQEVCDKVTFMKEGKVVDTLDVEKLIASSRHLVTLRFGQRSTVLDPPAAIGAENIQRSKITLSFTVAKANRQVLRWIASQDIEDASIVETKLDSVFMTMYKEDE